MTGLKSYAGKKDHESKLFYNVTLEYLVPKNHVIRKIDEVLNLEFLYKETEEGVG